MLYWCGCWERLLLGAKPTNFFKLRIELTICRAFTYKMVHADINPCHQVLLCDVLAVEEFVEIDHRFTGQVHVPHGAGRWLCVLAARNGEVVASPVRVFKQSL
jgi:hypothetical protein